MTSIRKAHFPVRQIDNQIHSRREHRFLGLRQDHVQTVIDRAEKLPRISGVRNELIEQPAQNRRHQRRAHSVPHHIANKRARERIADRENVEEIAADRCRRKVTMRES